MIKSAEMRWFLLSIPDDVNGFFKAEAGSSFTFEEVRTDYYLDVQAYPNLSFKIRDGKLEVKTLSEDLGAYNLSDTASGKVEKWIKWSSQLKKELQTPNEIFESGVSFIAIKKERKMIKYALESNGRLRKAGKNERDIAAGCQVELTKIATSEKSLYSFGLESFGTDQLLISTLLTTADKVFDQIKSPLSIEDSYSYPAFLSNMK